MTSHYQQSNVIPLRLYDTLEERSRIAAVEADVARDIFVMRLQRFISFACIGIALGTIAYFIAEFVR